MKTKIIPKTQIKEAVKAIEKGELVAFPTETVYGLGADATNEEAVKNVFAAKGRPSDNPLIIHVGNINQIDTYVDSIPEKAQKLMNAFWPGPLTLIFSLKEQTDLSKRVTGGLETAAFRMPNNQLTLDLINQSKKVLVGPSANTSGRPSPTKVEHVMHDLSGKIFGVLDGGDCEIGIESTVLDLSGENQKPTILRPGAITKEQIEAVIGSIDLNQSNTTENDQPKAPGMKYKHYAPKVPVIMIDYKKDNWQQAIETYKKNGLRVGLIANNKKLEELTNFDACYPIGTTRNVKEAMRCLFAALRELDTKELGLDVIFVETFEEKDEGTAFMNRLKKASNKNIFHD